MRALALVAVLLAQSIEPSHQDHGQVPAQEDHRCTTFCAAIEKDSDTHKACACAAGSGAKELCDGQGNRTTEDMPGCRNGKWCYRHCCHCCPP